MKIHKDTIKTEIINKLHIIDFDGIPSVDSDEVDKVLREYGLLQDFQRWFAGQTGGLTEDGKFLVYKHDLEQFLDGKEVSD